MRRLALAIACLTLYPLITPQGARGADLKPETAAAFDLYIQAWEKQMDADVRAGRFLVVDRLNGPVRQQAYEELQQGRLYIARQEVLQAGRAIPVPDGIIHDWAGAVFIRGATLEQVRLVLQDFADAPKFFKPELEQFQVVGRDSDTVKLLLRVYFRSIVAVTYHVALDAHPFELGDDRLLLRYYSTRIAEVRNPGEPQQREYPVGKDSGYLWRLCGAWRLEQKDGGVYVGLEGVSLSRGIPTMFELLVRPLTETVPKRLLSDLLSDARMAVLSAPAAAPAH